jgi:AcrR family transcriptional regulator
VTISDAQRRKTEDSIRAAIDRLLRGQIPSGGACDVTTLASEAGVSRAALYRSYGHLKDEFTRRLSQIQAEGHLPDPRAAQIGRLEDENAQLRERLRTCEQQLVELTGFRTNAISRLAAQHDEIVSLRQALAAPGNVRALPTTTASPS